MKAQGKILKGRTGTGLIFPPVSTVAFAFKFVPSKARSWQKNVPNCKRPQPEASNLENGGGYGTVSDRRPFVANTSDNKVFGWKVHIFKTPHQVPLSHLER
jgi:hypothetical protein